MSTTKKIKGFYAYSANPPALAETIENAINEINNALSEVLKIDSWKSSVSSGTVVINQVCKEIDQSDLFICDLSVLSMNVLFELGYAIARNKRVWITLDSSQSKAKHNYKRLTPLSEITCTYYENSYDLRDKFFKQEPFNDLKNTLYESLIASLVETPQSTSQLFYLKCGLNTEASVQLTQYIKKLPISVITDDPDEVSGTTIEWYAKSVYGAKGVIAHFLDENRETDGTQNSTNALISGIACGSEIPLLMIAQTPFNPPIDFRGILRTHDTAKSCLELAAPWLDKISKEIDSEESIQKSTRSKLKDEVALRKVSLGQYIAENEEKTLSNYFVETAPYTEALRTTQYLIYVGRKGTGKTANLFQLEQELARDRRNHVCVIQPVDYELEGVLSLLNSSISKTNPGFLAESLWKFLVYTELATSVHKEIQERPSHLDLSDVEKNFCDYVDSGQQLIKAPFTERMEYAIRELCEVEPSDSFIEQRARVSEILHRQIISDLRMHLGYVLNDREKVVILVDNLDKAWRKRSDLAVLADFLYGLLGAGQEITSQFQKRGTVTWKPVNLILIIFLRSDIFSFIVTNAREGDKVTAKQIPWDDPILLERIIEERFLAALDWKLDESEVWKNYFAPDVKGMPAKDYIISRIIPRPRDIIFFCSAALDNAINHRHSKIEQNDIIQAERNYSKHVFETLLSETRPIINNMKELLYEFVGVNEIVTEEQVREFMGIAGIPMEDYHKCINLLCERTFLGIEKERDHFAFLYDEEHAPVVKKLAEKNAAMLGIKRYKINIPFHAYLEISDQESS